MIQKKRYNDDKMEGVEE